MVIAEINDGYEPMIADGVSNVTKNYTIQMNNLGNKAYAIVPGTDACKKYDIDNHLDYIIRGRMNHVSNKIDPYGIVTYPREVMNKINAIDFDIVHAHSPFFAGSLGLKIASKSNIPIVSTFHTFFRDDVIGLVKNKTITDAFIRNLMRFYYKVDEVWTPSEESKEKIYDEYHFDKPIRVVENGCDMLVPGEDELLRLRDEGYNFIGGKKDVPVLLYIGQHKDEKNIPLILSALKLLNSRGHKFQMIFIGDGPKKHDYEKFVTENNLNNCIKFLGKISDRNIIREIYSIAYLFLFPSLYDTSCLVMREAAAFKVPLFYIEGACTSRRIVDGETGFLIQNNPSDFAGKIASVLDNPNLRNHVGEGAKSQLYKSWSDVAVEVQGLYKEIIEKKKSEI